MQTLGVLIGVLIWSGSSLAGEQAKSANAYDFSFTAIEGHDLPMARFQGKVVLVVNTASLCGFTYQYGGLQSLWERYRDQGLVVLAVPSNDFGGQEPGDEAEIKEFCEVRYLADFPMTTKEHVKGKKAHPFYKWAAKVLGFAAKPRWNFHKYLIGPEGHLIDWFPSSTKPTAEPVIKAVEAQLARAARPQG